MSLISIPEPCHENWADFTPTEKGAFCGSCQIDVVDFSNKSSHEITSILKENAGKHMCGRFRKSQLNEINEDYTLWQNQSVKTFQSKFLYACLMVFGMSLFTSCTTDRHALAELTISNVNLAEQELLTEVTPIDTNKNKQNYRKGKVAYVPEEITCGTPPDSLEEEIQIKGEIAFPVEEMIMGDTIYYPPTDTLKDTSATQHHLTPQDTLFNDEMIDGKMKVDKNIIHSTTHDNPAVNPITTSENVFNVTIYPNPSSTRSVLMIEVQETTHFNIYLYSVQGKKVKDLYSGELSKGSHQFKNDLTHYNSGEYLIVVQTQHQKESIRLTKIE